MVKDFVQRFSGGADGAVITGTNSGSGASGDAFNNLILNSGTDVTAAGNAFFTYNAAAAIEGSMGARFSSSGITGNTYASWNIPAGNGKRAVFRVPFNFPAAPGATHIIGRFSSTTTFFQLIIQTNRQLQAINGASGGIVASNSAALTAGVQYWIEFAATIGTTTSNGALEYKVVTNSNADGTGTDTVITNWTGTGLNTSTDADFTGVRFHAPLATSGWSSLNTDLWRVRITTDTAAFLGPIVPQSVSGTAASVSTAVGSASGLLAGVGVSAASSAAAGALAALLVVGGQASAASAATGAATVLRPATGSATSVSSATGAATAVLGMAGVASCSSAAAGSPTTVAVAQVFSVSGSAPVTSDATGSPTALYGIAGSAASTSAATGNARQDRDITVVSIAEVVRDVAVTEVPWRDVAVTELPRPFTVQLSEGGAMELHANAREWYQLTIVTDPAVESWDASFDGGLTWFTGDYEGRLANTWRWLVAGPSYVTVDNLAAAAISLTITPLLRATDTPEVVIRYAPPIRYIA